MPSSGWRGPFSLTKDNINKTVTKKCAGVYALGYSRKDRFHILYVGRSDSDVGDRLKDHLGVQIWYGQTMNSYNLLIFKSLFD